jgi:hypothetical protein
VTHAVRGVECDHNSRPAFTNSVWHGDRLFHERLRESRDQQQDREATQAEQKDVTQANLPRAHVDCAAQKLHGGPIRLFELMFIQ